MKTYVRRLGKQCALGIFPHSTLDELNEETMNVHIPLPMSITATCVQIDE